MYSSMARCPFAAACIFVFFCIFSGSLLNWGAGKESGKSLRERAITTAYSECLGIEQRRPVQQMAFVEQYMSY
jgi:hypothetical protein